MLDLFKHLHSINRWIVLVLLVAAVVIAISKWMSKDEYKEGHRKLFLFTLIFSHIQLLLGIVLMFISTKVVFDMSNAVYRFFSVEHTMMMVLGIILITIGFSRHKRKEIHPDKFKTVAIFYGLGLLMILSRIPWPFMEGFNAGWY